MARKINMVADKVSALKHKEPEGVSEAEEIDYDAIEEREGELDELIISFICDITGADSPEERDVVGFGIRDELEEIKNEFEEILASHGVLIYRPTVVMDDDGNEVLLNNSYE